MKTTVESGGDRALYASVTEIRVRARCCRYFFPSNAGRIDKYGHYTDTERPSRVALSNYGLYYSLAEIIEFLERAMASFDPYFYISRSGYPPRGRNWDGSPFSTTGGGAPFRGVNSGTSPVCSNPRTEGGGQRTVNR